MAPDDIPLVGDIKEKYVPYIKMLRASGTRRHARAGGTGPPATGPGMDQPMSQKDLESEEGKMSLILWAMKRHQGELRMFGGVWKKHANGEIPGALTSSSSSRRRRSSPIHVRAGPHRPSHLHGLGDPSSGEPGRAPGTGTGDWHLLGEEPRARVPDQRQTNFLPQRRQSHGRQGPRPAVRV